MKKFSNLSKHILKYFAVLCLSGLIFAASGISVLAEEDNIPDSSSENESTQVLSGKLEGLIETDAGITKVVLNGVDGQEDSTLFLNSSAIVEIADGTENCLGSIVSAWSIELTGGGSLKLSEGIGTFSGDLVCNNTGTITVSEGSIASTDGDIVVDKGTLNINNSQEGDCAVLSGTGAISLNGGSLETKGQGGSVIAGGGIEVAETVKLDGGSQVKKVEDSEGTSAYIIADKDGNESVSVKAKGPDAENEVHIETGTDSEEALSENNKPDIADNPDSSNNDTESAGATAKADSDSEGNISDSSKIKSGNENDSGTAAADSALDDADTSVEKNTSEASDKNNNQSGTRTALIIVIIVVVLAAAAAIYFTLAHHNKR